MEDVTNLRQELHQYPELSGYEKLTAQRLIQFLSKYKPNELHTDIAGVGIAAVYKGKESGPTILFRCDMDALPIQEENEFETLYPETIKERHVGKRPVEADYSAMSEEDVDNLENVPAYRRRQLRMNDPQYHKQKSNFSVSSDNKISDKNSYIFKHVD